MAIRLADKHKIPVFNMRNKEVYDKIRSIVGK
jgi:hypothetical protein